MRAQAGWAIYQAHDGTYEAGIDYGDVFGRRRACAVASLDSAHVISEEWNRTAALAAGIREHRLKDGPEIRGRDAAQERAEQPTDPAPRAATRLSLVDGST